MENQIVLFEGLTDASVKDQVLTVMKLGNRTIEESFKLGEMLVMKKAEKKHGEWLPFLEWCGLSKSVAYRLITAFDEKDKFIEGMTFSELAHDVKLPESGSLSTPQPTEPIEPPPPPPPPAPQFKQADLCEMIEEIEGKEQPKKQRTVQAAQTVIQIDMKPQPTVTQLEDELTLEDYQKAIELLNKIHERRLRENEYWYFENYELMSDYVDYLTPLLAVNYIKYMSLDKFKIKRDKENKEFTRKINELKKSQKPT